METDDTSVCNLNSCFERSSVIKHSETDPDTSLFNVDPFFSKILLGCEQNKSGWKARGKSPSFVGWKIIAGSSFYYFVFRLPLFSTLGFSFEIGSTAPYYQPLKDTTIVSAKFNLKYFILHFKS